MADIAKYLANIKRAIYGEEVRGSIHDAIEAINSDVHDFVRHELDSTLTSSSLPAPAKIIGDQLKTLKDNLAESFKYAGTEWAQNSGAAHSTGIESDWVYLPCAAGETVYVDAHTLSRESGIRGSVVCYNYSKQTVGSSITIVTGTPINITLSESVTYFALYLNAPSSTTTVHFSVYKGSSALNKNLDDQLVSSTLPAQGKAVGDKIKIINDNLAESFKYAGTEWIQESRTTHSTSIDRVYLPCAAGEKVFIDIHTLSREQNVQCAVRYYSYSGAQIGESRIYTGTPISVTVPDSVTWFGIYVPTLSSTTTVHFSIYKESSVLNRVVDDQLVSTTIPAQGKAVGDKIKIINDNLAESFKYAGTEWTQESGATHATSIQSDWVILPCAAGEKVYVDVHTLSREKNVSGTVTYYSYDGTNVGQANIKTGTPVTISIPSSVYSFRLFLNALSSTTTVHFSVYKESSILNEVTVLNGKVSTINTLLSYTQYSFVTNPVNHGHSSSTDRITVNIPTGSEFEIMVTASNGETVDYSLSFGYGDNQIQAFGNYPLGTKKYIQAQHDYTSLGVYVAPMTTDATIFVTYISSKSPLFSGSSDELDIFNSNIDDTVTKLAAQKNFVNGVSFVFITDMHWERNWHGSPELVNRICNKSRVRLVINGGDVATGDGEPFWSDGSWMREWLYKCTSAFNGNYDYFTIRGNHDTNVIGTWAQDVTNHELSLAQVRQLMLPSVDDVEYPNKTYAGFTEDADGILSFPTIMDGSDSTSVSNVPCYYYFNRMNTTFICLDTGMVGGPDPDQIVWAQNVIETTSKPYIIIFMHVIWGGDGEDDGAKPCSLFKALMSMIEALDPTDKAKIQAIFSGHLHIDRNEFKNGIPIVVTDTDSRYANDGIDRIQGTLTQQCFDVVTINYDTKTIYCNRIGTIGTDRIIDYNNKEDTI